MKNNTGFKIKKTAHGVNFEKYDGPNVEVLEIPEGVTRVSKFALRYSNLKGCRKIVFPVSLKVVEMCALNYDYGDCKNLAELEFLGDVEAIEESAFNYVSMYDSNQIGIQKITFHGKVGKIGKYAFGRSQITCLEFPNGVNEIGTGAFAGSRMLKEIHAPGIKKIGGYSFIDCVNLEVIDIPENASLGENAFKNCQMLKKNGVTIVNGVLFELDEGKKIPNGVVTIDRYALGKYAEIPATVRVIHEQKYGGIFVLPEGLLLTDEKLGGKGLMSYLQWNHQLTLPEVAALYLFQSGKEFEKLISPHLEKDAALLTSEMVQLLNAKGKAKHYLRAVDFCIQHAGEIPVATIQSLYDIGMQKTYKKETELLKPYLSSCDRETKVDKSDICAPWREIYNEHLMDKTLKALGLKKLDTIRLADGSGNAPAYLVKCAIAPYVDLFKERPKCISKYESDYISTRIIEDADRAAELLDREELAKMLSEVSFLNIPQAMIPYCRYASGKMITELISTMHAWESWHTYAATGRAAIIVARGALMLSETREAMLYLEKCTVLENYAALRGMDTDVIRDTKLMEFGLDANGCTSFDLGSTIVEASVGQDLAISLYDTKAQKTVRSLPKKGVDPEKHAATSAVLSNLKKNLKKVVKSRNDILFKRFLNGKTQSAEGWIASYTNNPVLHRVAELLVWNQNRYTFILTADGIVDCNGNNYTINPSEPIGVAHPMEMEPEEIKAWQKYFTSRGLKQPFEQIWEPVVDPDTAKKDRYAGCLIPYYRFLKQEKHGVHVRDEDFHNEITIWMDDCNVNVERIDWERHAIDINHRFEIKEFAFKKYTRQVNHLVTYFDRITVYDRIRNDDVSVAEILPRFTLAQITEFINVAVENNCTNVSAILLDYKNRTFSDFDPMDLFSLEW